MVEVSGVAEVHPRWGRQVHILEVHDVRLPMRPEGIETLLAAHLPRAGSARIGKIVGVLGIEAITKLNADPSLLEQLFPGRVGRQMVLGWEHFRRAWEADERAADLAARLVSAGIPYRMARRIVGFFRSPAVGEILLLRHPYRLLDVPGFGWKRADRIARQLGVDEKAPERTAAAVGCVLEEAMSEGHSALPRQPLIDGAAKLLGGAKLAAAGIQAAEEGGWIVESGGLFYLPAALEAEWLVVDRLRRHAALRRELSAAELRALRMVAAATGLSAAQAAAVQGAFTHGVFLLTGGPGTGKTTTGRAIVTAAARLGLRLRVVAPTGKAASRATDVMGVQAETVHRLLGCPPGQRLPRPIPADLVLVDECSMVSLEVLAWLLMNLPATAQVVLIGDSDQLPAVDHGAVLQDLLESQVVPSARLTEVHRAKATSGIILNAHRLLRGDDLDRSRSDFIFADVTDRRNPTGPPDEKWEREYARDRLAGAIRWLRDQQGVDVSRDLQVLSPTRKGRLGVESLNGYLQSLLNPEGRLGPLIRGGRRVRVGDRVTQVRNDYTLGEVGIFNGEQGAVVAVAADSATVLWDGDREVRVEGYRLFNLELAWAVTVHRSQGSEWKNVITLTHRSHGRMLSPRLLYTAVTRAKDRFILIGDLESYRIVQKRAGSDRDRRFTGLRQRLASRFQAPGPHLADQITAS
jgi:exodeoxyribonuclease V alpha subunit